MAESPTSVRLPGDLRDRVEKAAAKANQNLNEFIVTALEMRLEGVCETCGRDSGAAYWDAKLAAWCAALVRKPQDYSPTVVVATDEGAAGRNVYLGRFRGDAVRETILGFEAQGKNRPVEVAIPRSSIVVFDSNPNMYDLLIKMGFRSLR